MDPHHLVVEGGHVVGKQPGEPECVPFLAGEGDALVEQRVLQQLAASHPHRQVDLAGVGVDPSLEVGETCHVSQLIGLCRTPGGGQTIRS